MSAPGSVGDLALRDTGLDEVGDVLSDVHNPIITIVFSDVKHHSDGVRYHNCDMPTLSERLRKAREEKGLTQTDLAKAAGCGQSVIGNLESGTRKSSSYLARMAAVLGKSPLWLSDGIGPENGPEGVQAFAPAPSDYLPVRRAELKLSAGAHGYGIEYQEGESRPIFFRADWFALHGYEPERLIALRVAGQSMETSLFDGDVVVINLADAAPADGEVFAANYEGEAVIKRMRRDGGEWWLTSDNADKRRYPDKRCTEDVKILGRAVYKQSERI